ncbi:DUF6476 family protein [Hansschlegelia quercus]|uniref:Fimbrial protein n=1 Tax=Hansschlegelia quercus TaxID=2528245 RepID=A0A4Q9GI79_9HYPH|nr:DUF6476 family protein [Hansschlegelia quercus]TBN53903.1 hypothetical protein EYR15_08955 [Hansschlegelia quercus]
MTAQIGSPGPSLDEVADDEDPRIRRVYARLRRLTVVGAVTMGVGFLALVSVIAYRVVKSSAPSGQIVERTLALPAGARIISTTADSGRLIVTVEAEGRATIHIVDAATLAETGRLSLAPGGASVPPLR